MYVAIRNRIATGHLKIGCFITLVTKILFFLTIYWVWLSNQFSCHNCDNYPLNEFSAHKRPLDSWGNFSSVSEHGSLYKSEAIKHLEKYSLLKKLLRTFTTLYQMHRTVVWPGLLELLFIIIYLLKKNRIQTNSFPPWRMRGLRCRDTEKKRLSIWSCKTIL